MATRRKASEPESGGNVHLEALVLRTVHEVLREDIGNHRAFLETQLKHAKWFVGVIVAVTAGAAVALGWSSLSAVEDSVSSRINQKVDSVDGRLDMKVEDAISNDSFKARLARFAEGLTLQLNNAELSAAEKLNAILRSSVEKAREDTLRAVDNVMKTSIGNDVTARIEKATSDRIDEIQRTTPSDDLLRSIVPIGAIVAWPGPAVDRDGESLLPKGWHLCDGTPLSDIPDADHKELLRVLPHYKSQAVIRAPSKLAAFARGDRSFEVNCLPDYRGYFLRGLDPRSPDHDGRDPGTRSDDGGVGSTQDASACHTEMEFDTTEGPRLPSPGKVHLAPGSPNTWLVHAVRREDHEAGINTDLKQSLSQETRPVNVAVHWIIRVR